MRTVNLINGVGCPHQGCLDTLDSFCGCVRLPLPQIDCLTADAETLRKRCLVDYLVQSQRCLFTEDGDRVVWCQKQQLVNQG